MRYGFFVFLILFISVPIAVVYCQEDADNTVKALEIYKKRNNKSFVIKIDDKVMVPCYYKKGKRKSLTIARLVDIEGSKIYFEPLNRHFRKTLYGARGIKDIGIHTTWSLIHSAYFFVSYVMNKDYRSTVYATRNSFRMFNMKTKKYGVRIISDYKKLQ